MTDPHELELKFHVQPSQRAGLLKALGHRKLERIPLEAHYVDTPDGLLARHQFALRVRREGVRWVQTLKGAGPSSDERLEHEVELDANSIDDALPLADPARHRGTPVGDRLLKLLDAHERPALDVVYVVEVVRIRRLLQSHGATIEWALDEGTVRAGDAVATISELELEFKGGQRSGLMAAALDWQGRHGLWLDSTSKSERGRLLVEGLAHRPPERASVPDWTPRVAKRLDGPALLRRLVACCLAQILPNASELARGSGDPEHVHQLRVGLRRLRSVVREMASSAPGLDPEWEAPVVRVFEALGAVRDRQVFETSLAPELRDAGAPVVELASARSDETLATLGEHVRGAPFQAALLQLLAFADTPVAPASIDDDAPLRHLRRRLARLQRRVTRDADDFETLDFAAQHRARKRLKRLRYTAAFLAPLFPSRDVEAWLKAVKPAQAVLGRHVDLLTAARRFEAAVLLEPGAWFAVGWLKRAAHDSAREGRKRLRRLEATPVFW